VIRGVAAEYGSEAALIAAIGELRARGLRRVEAYSPVPSDAIDHATGARRSRLAIAAGAGAIGGVIAAYLLQWWLDAYLYPVDAGGRPPHMPLPFAIITIEMGFLVSAITVVVAFVVRARLVTLWHPVFELPGIESATRAGYWVAIDARDPAWDGEELVALLRATAPVRIHGFGGLG
jgi:hypothetical protein